MTHVEGVTIIGRRSGVETRQSRNVPPPVFPEDIEAIILKDVEEKDRRKRYWNGWDEFEPIFICIDDDPELCAEFANDPDYCMWVGERENIKDPNSWKPFIDEHGNRYVKVVLALERDHEHLFNKRDRWIGNQVNLTEGEQAEIKRRSNGSRLKEEELSMDHRSPSKFGWDDLGFQTVYFELPNFPESRQMWLDAEAWPLYNRISERLISHLHNSVKKHRAEGDNRRREVKAKGREEQEQLLNGLFTHFHTWWNKKVDEAKSFGRYAPLASKHVASIYMIIETFRVEMGFDTPIMRFWAKSKCTVCGVEKKGRFALDTTELFCGVCGDLTVEITEWDPHDILDPGPPSVDWWERAAELQSRINALYAEAADLEQIDPLERYLRYIEVEHIKFNDPSMIFYSAYPEIDARFM